MPSPEARVALVGAGTIGARYVESLRQNPGFEVLAVCSKSAGKAAGFARDHELVASTLADILADPAINFVLNLTPAQEHYEITKACLDAGKSVYSEKPLAATLAEADLLIEMAAAKGLLLACAPATFLWPALATARRLVRDGSLAWVTGALSTLVYPGPELFHPNPAHLYSAFAGPLRDMGVYQITALMMLLGPVTAVSALASTSREKRSVLVGPDAGQSFPILAPTHIHAQFLHSGGAISSLIVSFDGTSASPPMFDIFAQAGGLSISNAHTPEGTVTMRRKNVVQAVICDEPAWHESQWAIGAVSAWNAYHAGEIVEANAQRARSVLEVMLAIEEAAASGCFVNIVPTQDW